MLSCLHTDANHAVTHVLFQYRVFSATDSGARAESSASSVFGVSRFALFCFGLNLFLFHMCGESRLFVVNFTAWLLANWRVEIAKAGKRSSTSAQLRIQPRHIISLPMHTCNKQTTCRRSLPPSLSAHAEPQGQRASMLPVFVGERAGCFP